MGRARWQPVVWGFGLGLVMVVLAASLPGSHLRAAPKSPSERRLYHQIIKAFFPSKKSKLARELGRLQTPAALKALKRLYKRRDRDDRLAALDGLFERKDASLGPWFVAQLNTVKQPRLRKRLGKGLGADMARYLDALLRAMPAVERLTADLLKGLTQTKDKRVRGVLLRLLKGPPAHQRTVVASLLLKHHPSDDTARRVLATATVTSVHERAWVQLLNRGTQADLPSFLALLDGKHSDPYRAVAYRATRKWGTRTQQQKVFAKALQSKRETLVLLAIKIFDVKTPAVRRALCDWVQHGKYQTTRLSAAQELSTFPTRHVVGCLILALREIYYPNPPDRSVIKYVAGILSFGLGFWHMHRERKKRRRAFTSILTGLSARLRKMTGVDFGNDYHTWLDWALRHGYTVGDMNLVQLLFSPYKRVRLRAQRDAIWLMDDRGERLKRKHASDKDDGARFRVALAHLLIDAGLLTPRRIPLASAPAPVAPHSERPMGTGCGGCRGCYSCHDCDDCDTGHSGRGGLPVSWILVTLWFWFRRRRGRRAPKTPTTALLILAITCGIGAAGSAEARGKAATKEARLAAKIRSAKWNSDRQKLAVKLGSLRTVAARAMLVDLLKELKPWEGKEVVPGLLALKDPTLLPVFLRRLHGETWVGSAIATGLIADMPLYFTGLAKAFRAPHKKKHRGRTQKLLEIIAKGKDPRCRKFLQGLVTERRSIWRQHAMDLLLAHWSPESDAFIRSQVQDKIVGRSALQYILRKGSAADLPLFRRLANGPGAGDRVTVGFRGISRFGDTPLKESTFARELRGKSEARAQLAMLSFSVRSPSLMQSICRWARSSDDQSVRIAAIFQLVRYDTRQAIPCLVPFLREEYDGSEGSSILHGFVAFLSLGISAVSIDAQKAASINGFTGAQRRVAKHLAKISGVDHQSNYWRWRDWAAEQGYTVDGQNLFGALLSSDVQRRKRAQTSALALLGFADRAKFAARHPPQERSFSLALVAQLQARGHLKEQPLPARKALVKDQVREELKQHLKKMIDTRSLVGKLLGCNCRQSAPGSGVAFLIVALFLLWRRRRVSTESLRGARLTSGRRSDPAPQKRRWL